MAYAGKFQGTYFDPTKGRLALQLKSDHKRYGIDAIHEAAALGDLEKIMKTWRLEENIVFHVNSRGQNVFHILARFGHFIVLEKMFEYRLNKSLKPLMEGAFDRGVRELDKNKQRVLHHAVQHPAIIDLLLAKVFGRRGGNAINGIDYKLRTPLHRACLLGVPKSVELLLEAGASLAEKDQNLITPLHLACTNGSFEVVKILIDFKHHLIDKKRKEMLEREEEKRKLASRGMSRSQKSKEKDYHALDELTFLTWLCAKDDQDQTALDIACKRGHDTVVELLAQSGAMKDVKSLSDSLSEGNEPEHFDFAKANQKHHQNTSENSSSGSPIEGGQTELKRNALPWGGLAAPEIPMDITTEAAISSLTTTSPKLPKLLPIETAVMGGQLSTVTLLRRLGAGTSVAGAAVAVHKPVMPQSLISRSDGICEQCLFRQQWQCGHRRDDYDASTKTTVLPELRSWRTV